MHSTHQPGMRLLAENTVYKRQPSRDLFAMDGVESNSVPTTGTLSAAPPWQLSLPHVCVALMSAILFGYHLGVVNIPLQYIARDLEFADSSIAQGFVVSICLIGAFGGCAMSGMVADWLGRRRAFQISTLPMILGTALSAVAPVLAVMLIGRLLVGIGLGIGGPVLSLYISEISPTEIRGMYGSLSQIATCCGILGSLLVGLPISTVPGWWRACFWIATVPAALLLLGMEFCAESPRWLFKKSRWYEAEHELERLWGLSYAKTGMVHLLQNEESEDENTTSSWEDLFDKRYIRVVMIGSALFALQQLSGINAIFYFSATVFRKAGVSSDVAASVCVGVINLLGSCIAAYLMDRKGRRSLLIWSFSGMAFAMAMQAAVGSLHAASSLQGSISLLATSLYVFMFAIGAGPVPALLLPEIFPNAIRAKAMSVAMCVHWVGNVLIGLTYLDLLHHLGAATLYSFFTAVCLLAALFVKKHVLETKGRSLEDIEAFLLGGL